MGVSGDTGLSRVSRPVTMNAVGGWRSTRADADSRRSVWCIGDFKVGFGRILHKHIDGRCAVYAGQLATAAAGCLAADPTLFGGRLLSIAQGAELNGREGVLVLIRRGAAGPLWRSVKLGLSGLNMRRSRKWFTCPEECMAWVKKHVGMDIRRL